MNTKLKPLALILAALTLSACSVTPKALNQEEIRDRVTLDKSRLYAEQEPVSASISFEEALSRTLKYNLDHRLKLMENALADGLLEVGKYEMLPSLITSAGYTKRDFPSAEKSFTIVNGNIVDNVPGTYSGSTEAQRHTYNIDFSWNILDFGVSYYRSKILADQYLIAEERRRKVIQNIYQDVTSAYWRALGAQRMVKQADELLVEVKSTLETLRLAQNQGIVLTKESLASQRALLDTINLLTARRQELLLAKRELQALMNLEPNINFEVSEIAEPTLKALPKDLEKLEDLALFQRPELRQEDLQKRITANETKKQLVSFFPNVNFTAGLAYDSNKYAYDNSWTEVGTKIGFNLFKLFAIPSTLKARDTQEKVDDARRMALSMAVLTQVRVSLERYQMALNELDVIKESHKVDSMSKEYAKASLNSKIESEVEYLRAKAKSLNTEFQRYQAYAAAQNAYGRMLNAVGMEFKLPEEDLSVKELAAYISKEIKTLESQHFEDIKLVETKSLPIMLDMPTSVSEQIKTATSNIFKQANSNLVSDSTAHRLVFRHTIEEKNSPIIKAQVNVLLVDANNKVVNQSEFNTFVNKNYNEKTLMGLYQSAANHALQKMSNLAPKKTFKQ